MILSQDEQSTTMLAPPSFRHSLVPIWYLHGYAFTLVHMTLREEHKVWFSRSNHRCEFTSTLAEPMNIRIQAFVDTLEFNECSHGRNRALFRFHE